MSERPKKGDKNWRGKYIKRASLPRRDVTILNEYMGLNEDQVRVPASVLARRFRLSRQRIHTIVNRQQEIRGKKNERLANPSTSTEEDALLVSEMLAEMLGGG